VSGVPVSAPRAAGRYLQERCGKVCSEIPLASSAEVRLREAASLPEVLDAG
jgi:hypothetical protein